MKKGFRVSICAGLVLALMLLALPCALAEQSTIKLSYEVNNGQLTLTGVEGALMVIIPNEADVGSGSMPVTEIAYGAFSDSPELTRVTIPASVTYINSGAFYGNAKLELIQVNRDNPNYSSVDGGLYNKNGSTLIVYAQGARGLIKTPDTLVTVDPSAFERCRGITDISFNVGLERIGSDAFSGCSNLKTVSLPRTLTSMPSSSPFQANYALTTISVSGGNEEFVSKEGALYQDGGAHLYAYPVGASGKITLPDGVRVIGSAAFANAEKITRIVLPSELYEIGSFAFLGCVGLTRVEVPDGVALIGRSAFNACTGLESLRIPASVVDIGEMSVREHVVIECERGSYADTFAQENNIKQLYFDPITGETSEPGEGVDSPASASADGDDASSDQGQSTLNDGPYDQMLVALNDELIAQTYTYLKQPDALIEKGSKGDDTKGLQQLLNVLGDKLTVDGSIGAKTITALNSAQQNFALDQTENVTRKEFELLIENAFIAQDPDAASDMLGNDYGEQIRYVRACSAYQNENFFTAYELFMYLDDYKDSQERMQTCAQKWPKNGQVVRNGHKGSAASLTIKTTQDEEHATYVKIYTEEDEFVAGVFIGAKGSGRVNLPKGKYVLKTGVGTTWYGPNEAFGQDNDSYYRRLTFDDGSDLIQLKSNYSYTLTLGGATENNVGTEYESADDF